MDGPLPKYLSVYLLGTGVLSYVTTAQLPVHKDTTLLLNVLTIFQFCPLIYPCPLQHFCCSLGLGIALSCYLSLASFNLSISTVCVFYNLHIFFLIPQMIGILLFNKLLCLGKTEASEKQV